MTRHIVLSLSDDQLSAVLDGAGLVPAEWRTRYLDNVGDQLLGKLMVNGGDVDDHDVRAAVDATLRRIGVTSDILSERDDKVAAA